MEVKELLKLDNWVVAGDVLKREKYASKIYTALQRKGFNVSGVNPAYKGMNIETEGVRVYKTLTEVPSGVEVIDLCINPEKGMEIVKEAFELNVKNVILQPGAESVEILEFCKNNGIAAIKGCALEALSSIN